MLKFYCIIFFCILSSIVQSNDIELGKVNWIRDLKHAQHQSQLKNKPILILFQEVPGCITCKNYGTEVLSHPLIVEAIETYFIPLCIFNNHPGADRDALKLFNEPSWNNPVVRIVDNKLQNIVERLHGNYSPYGLLSKINASLLKTGIVIPEYLNLLEEEMRTTQSGIENATIGMYCFWSGEKTFGTQQGVVATQAGFMNGAEVVQITYDPKLTNLETLIKIGKQNNCADKLYTNDINSSRFNILTSKISNFRPDTETKYYLNQSDYKYLPMTAIQAMSANCLLSEGKCCESILSPGQIKRYHKIKSSSQRKHKNQIGRNIITAWYE